MPAALGKVCCSSTWPLPVSSLCLTSVSPSTLVSPPTDGPVPAVQEGGAHPESSVAVQKTKAGQGFTDHRKAGSGGALQSGLERIALW